VCIRPFQVTKELVELARQDGKRPDSLMLIQWQRRKPLTWHVTVDHTSVAYDVSATAVHVRKKLGDDLDQKFLDLIEAPRVDFTARSGGSAA